MRKVGNVSLEGDGASIALAGLRILKQTNISVDAANTNTYTVTEKKTRRVLIVHNAADAFDIRYKDGSAAAATDIPILPQFYFVVDRGVDDILGFRNDDAVAVTILMLELE